MEKSENINGATSSTLSTEFERSIARATPSNDSYGGSASEIPPLVDSHGGEFRKESVKAKSDNQLQALMSEVENLKQSVAKIAAVARGAASEQVDVTIADVEEALKRNVYASVGVAALIGFLWGRLR